ncbi:MAG TPA: EF-hand domain-containing protein [Polyangiaceae bacterium]|jgi:Ca2+-binding EF-hand superfamily protein|nr:EF-hand domain-containing protein [Polyangiaceae bacterium]
MSDPLKSQFDEFDTDENGSISESEFVALVAVLGLKLSAGEIQTAFSAIDINGNGRIDFGEFKAWWSKR